VRDALNVEVPLRTLFESPTVATFAEHITGMTETALSLPLVHIEIKQCPLSFAQQRLWFLDQLEPGNAFYNVSSAFRLSGPLDIPALEESFTEIVRRHEVLRTRFVVEDEHPAQVISPLTRLTLTPIGLSAHDQAERETEALRLIEEEAQRPFNLAEGCGSRRKSTCCCSPCTTSSSMPGRTPS
jgi:hypothetical protein